MNGKSRKLKQKFEGLKSATLKHPSFFVTQVLSILESPLSLILALALGILELVLLFIVGPDFEHIRTSYSLLLVWSNLEAGCLREPHFENFSEQEQTPDQDCQTCLAYSLGVEYALTLENAWAYLDLLFTL